MTRKVFPVLLLILLAAALVLAFAPASQASPGWSAPLNISSDTTTDNQEPQIALDSGGNPHAVWSGYDAGSVWRIYYSENTGSGWSAPLNISPGSTTGNAMPQIVLDAGGHPHVAWHGNDGSTFRVYYSENTGAGWSTPLNLSPGNVGNFNPCITLDAGGNPHVVWFGNDGLNERIYYSENTGAGWSTPLNISTNSTGNWTPQIALDASGNPHAVWRGDDGGSVQRIYYSENTGAGWSTPLNISNSSINNSDPRLALDASGNPHIVWQGRVGSDWWVYYSENTGSGWSTPLNLSTGSSDNSDPQIALDTGGHPHVVWYGWDSATWRVYYSTNTGSGWSAELNLSPGTTDNSYQRIALDASGHPHVIWHGTDGSTYRVYYSTNSGSGWSAPLSISSTITDNLSLQIALDGGGNPHAVWQGNDASAVARIYYAEDVPYTFYFAEGYTGPGFREYLCLGNPAGTPVKVKVTYLFQDGTSVEKTYDVPALSRFTADVNTEVGPDKDVSIKCEAASSFVAERPMYFEYQGRGGSWTGGSDAVGASLPSTSWYFAEGYTGPGFDEWVCVLNPWGSEAHLTFNFQTQEDGLVVPTGTYKVPAHSRGTFKANDLLEGKSYQTSLKLVSDVPVVAERPMYFEYSGTGSWGWTGGHDVMGVPMLARDYYFAEGTTRSGFEQWLTLQNPGTAEITVNAVYQLGEGTPIPKEYKVAAGFRKTIYVPDEVGTEKDVSVHLTSASDFLAERPMYFDYQGTGSWGWTGGHCVIGAVAQGTAWFFAEGYTGAGFEEWLCIQNPGAAAAHVSITYYPQGGGAPIVKDPITVAANSRHTVFVNSDAGEGLSICATVASDKPVIVERPMYFNFDGIWTGGSDVVGYLP